MFITDTNNQVEEIAFYFSFAENFSQEYVLDFDRCFSVSSEFNGGETQASVLHVPGLLGWA